MLRYIIRRLLLLVVTLLFTSLLIFGLTQLLPGDIARLTLGRDASRAQLEAFREERGLNDAVPQQYARWLTNFVTGDWGKSYSAGGAAVRPLVMQRLGNSLRLGLLTLVLSVPLSVVMGVVAALNENRTADSIISVFSLAVVGLPEFVTGVALINIFAIGLKWFPATAVVSDTYTLGDWLRVLFLPAVTATLVLLGYISRMTRAGVLEELKKPYVQTAVLKGLPYHMVIFKHVLRNGLLPTITVIALSVGWLIGGLIVIENVFTYPGIGSLLVSAVEQKNIPLLQAVVMVIIFFFALSNLIADIIYGLLNPRIRLG